MRGEPRFAAELGSRRFWKDWSEAEMESERVGGREEQRGEESLMEWTRVFREDFEDLRFCFVAKDMNSCAEDCRDERSLFSIALSAL